MLYFNESLVSMLLALSLSAIYYAIFHIFIYKLLLTKKVKERMNKFSSKWINKLESREHWLSYWYQLKLMSNEVKPMII